MEIPQRTDVVIVGAGLSGLACARLLQAEGIDLVVLDSSDAVGGRMRSDQVEGFILDRGFQVLLTAYEELNRSANLNALDLQRFKPGSLIWTGKRLERLGDPFRNPTALPTSILARVGTIEDKLRVALLRQRLLRRPAQMAFDGPDRTTEDELRQEGFSEAFIDQFFRPFLGGVFLERDLKTSASLFRYYFRCFAAGDAAVPAFGIQRLPEQIAEPLGALVKVNTTVRSISNEAVTLDDGSAIAADYVVLATDGEAAAALSDIKAPESKAAITSYFSAAKAPINEPILILDGEGTGPANHVAVMSKVSTTYASEGRHLIAVSGVDKETEDPASFHESAQTQLTRWFGSGVSDWEHLRTYRVPHALPRHPPGFESTRPPQRTSCGAWVTGDYSDFGSTQGALRSGRMTAEALLAAIHT